MLPTRSTHPLFFPLKQTQRTAKKKSGRPPQPGTTPVFPAYNTKLLSANNFFEKLKLLQKLPLTAFPLQFLQTFRVVPGIRNVSEVLGISSSQIGQYA